MEEGQVTHDANRMPGLTYGLALAQAKSVDDLSGMLIALLTDLDMLHAEMPNRATCLAASIRSAQATVAALKEPA
jgi:hypothetical protein